MKLIKTIILCLSLAAVPFITGCESVTRVVQVVESNEVLAKAAVQYATLKVVGKDRARAERVVSGIEQARAVFDGISQPVSIAVVADQVRKNIQWDKLSLEDQVLVSLLIDEVGHRLSVDIQNGLIDRSDLTTAYKFLDWIEQAAALYIQADTK